MCVQMFLRKGQVLLLFNYGAPLAFKVRCITKEAAASINGLLTKKKQNTDCTLRGGKRYQEPADYFECTCSAWPRRKTIRSGSNTHVGGFTEAEEPESSTYIFDDAHQAKCGATVDYQVLLAQDEDLGNQDVQLDLVRR